MRLRAFLLDSEGDITHAFKPQQIKAAAGHWILERELGPAPRVPVVVGICPCCGYAACFPPLSPAASLASGPNSKRVRIRVKEARFLGVLSHGRGGTWARLGSVAAGNMNPGCAPRRTKRNESPLLIPRANPEHAKQAPNQNRRTRHRATELESGVTQGAPVSCPCIPAPACSQAQEDKARREPSGACTCAVPRHPLPAPVSNTGVHVNEHDPRESTFVLLTLD